jgi:hypothetical protein
LCQRLRGNGQAGRQEQTKREVRIMARS